MTPPLSPPVLRLVGALVPRRWRDSVVGDLVEERQRRVAAGLPSGVAWQFAAALAIGVRLALESLRQDSRAAHRPGRRMEQVWAETKHAVRMLATHRGHSALAIVTLALGIGANAAIFNVAHWLLFRPLPGVQKPSELVGIQLRVTEGTARSAVALSLVEALQAGAPALAQVAGHSGNLTSVDLVIDGRIPRRVDTDVVTANFFEVLRTPLEGRGFTEREGRDPALEPVAIVSDRLRRIEFGSESALGRAIEVNGTRVTIVGVAPPGFHGPRLMANLDLWLPAAQWRLALPGIQANAATEDGVRNRRMFFGLIARLHAREAAAALPPQLESVRGGLVAADPSSQFYATRTFDVLEELDLSANERERMRETFTMLLGLAAALLALACANVGNAVLARSASRAGELATRLALGATRIALARLLLIENLLLSLVAGAVSIGLAWAVARALEGTALLPGFAPIGEPTPDWRVVGFAVGLSMLTALLTGLAPMWSIRRGHLLAAFNHSARAYSPRRHRLRGVLLALQVAASVVLLLGAGLLARSIVAKLAVDTGFDKAPVLTFSLSPPPSDGVVASMRRQQFIDRLRRVPGVESASLAFLPPFYSGTEMRLAFHAETGGPDVTVARNAVRDGFFETIGLPFVDGRDFTAAELNSEEPSTTGPLVLTETVARRVFGSSRAVGRAVITSQGARRTIVGVVRASRHRRLLGDDSSEIVFEPFRGEARTPWVTLLANTSEPDAVMWPAIRGAMAEVAPTLAMFNAMSVDQGIRAELGQDLLVARIVPVFAALALIVAVLGFYGILARSVAERGRELGIRRALGATPRDVAVLVLREGLLSVILGAGAGVLMGTWLSRFIESRLYGVSRLDPLTFAAAATTIVVVMLLSALPVWRRATRIDPSTALRE